MLTGRGPRSLLSIDPNEPRPACEEGKREVEDEGEIAIETGREEVPPLVGRDGASCSKNSEL